jgi:hypothetical protein
VAVGGAGFVASLVGTYVAMRDVMTASGGFCARGGPYVVSSQCTSGQTGLLFAGVAGMFVFGALCLGFLAWMDGPVLGASLVGWAALFGLLGFNFIQLGLNKPGESDAHVGGWIVSGVVFWTLALAGLVPALALAAGWLRRRGAPEPPLFREPLVRAAVHPAPQPPASLAPPEQASVPTRLVIPERKWDDPPG